MRNKPHISTEELRRLYDKEGLSTTQIGESVGMSGQAVRLRYKMAGFKLEGKQRGRQPSTFDLELFLRLLNDETKSVAEIAKVWVCHESSVRSWLKRKGIDLRSVKRGLRRRVRSVPDLSLLAVGEAIILPHPETRGK